MLRFFTTAGETFFPVRERLKSPSAFRDDFVR
jgi:hypothetical protein